MHQKTSFVITVLLFITTSTFAYMVTDTQKYNGYSESKLTCTNGRETFVHKTPQGYYSSQYKRYKAFKAAANSSCEEKKYSDDLKEKTKYLKHNAKICKTPDSIERILSSEEAYYHSISRACFLAMNSDTINLLSYFDNATLIDRYYKVEYQDEIHYVREADIKFKKKVNIALPYIRPISKVKKHTNKNQKNIKKHKKFVKKKVKSRNIHKSKKLLKRKTKKIQRKTIVYYCRAISKSARGWSTAISLRKAKKSALHQCNIRSKTPKPCWLEKCYKK